MKFRPCIDLHQGLVKQIVGSTLTESENDRPKENFVSAQSAADFAEMYKRDGLTGGHVIMLGGGCEEAAISALRAYPQGLQIGGGIILDNAMHYLDAGASHVIVTSFVFRDGSIDFDRLKALSALVTPQRLVVDLSCRRKSGSSDFYVVTNKWTKYTDFAVTVENLQVLSQYCSEFLVHGVDVEGLQAGIDDDLVQILAEFAVKSGVPITYAGGVRSIADLERINEAGRGLVDCTVGSALDCFGGTLSYRDVVAWHNLQR